MKTKENVLQNCTVVGTTIKLPNEQLDRGLYQEVAKSLQLIGGKWKGGKVGGFVFQTDPTELLAQIANGEKRNLKKEFQFFATPSDLADELVEMAELKDDDVVLEPSAGQGAIIEAILRANNKANVFAIELMEINSIVLNKKGFHHELGDFLKLPNQPIYDKIIANPPFSKNQDIDHVIRMWECLKPGGRLVSITSKHWQLSNNKKETLFRRFLEEQGASINEIEPGRFKESGTAVGGLIIILDK